MRRQTNPLWDKRRLPNEKLLLSLSLSLSLLLVFFVLCNAGAIITHGNGAGGCILKVCMFSTNSIGQWPTWDAHSNQKENCTITGSIDPLDRGVLYVQGYFTVNPDEFTHNPPPYSYTLTVTLHLHNDPGQQNDVILHTNEYPTYVAGIQSFGFSGDNSASPDATIDTNSLAGRAASITVSITCSKGCNPFITDFPVVYTPTGVREVTISGFKDVDGNYVNLYEGGSATIGQPVKFELTWTESDWSNSSLGSTIAEEFSSSGNQRLDNGDLSPPGAGVVTWETHGTKTGTARARGTVSDQYGSSTDSMEISIE